MVKKTREESLVTRETILNAAIDVFFDKGVARASLEEIAERAGVTRGAIYWHFRNKCDIFDALHEQLHESVMETILTDLETDHPQPLQQLEKLCVALLRDLASDSSKCKVLSIFIMKSDYSGDMAVFLERQHANKMKSIELFAKYFERARKLGLLNESLDPHTVTLSLSFFMTGIVHEHVYYPGLFDLNKQAPELMKQFFSGLTEKLPVLPLPA